MIEVLIDITTFDQVGECKGTIFLLRQIIHERDELGDVDKFLRFEAWDEHVCVTGIDMARAVVCKVEVGT